MPHCRDLTINLCLLFGSVLLFFTCVELLVRITGLVKMEDYTPPIYQRSVHPEISYELKPGIREKAFRSTVTTNSLGFRFSEPDRTKPMIAVLGDSITFGYGVENEEALPAKIQSLLREYTVVNVGVPGYNIRQEVATFREKILPLNPKALILEYYWGDEDLRTAWLDEGGILREEGWESVEQTCNPPREGILSLLPGSCWLDRRSALYRGVKEFVNTRSSIRQRDIRREEAKQDRIEDSVREIDLEVYERELMKLTVTLGLDFPRLFIIWPNAEMHSDARPHLKQIAEKQGFVVLDLYDYFGNEMETLSWDYVHPSGATLAKAAAIISEALQPHLQ